MKVIMVMKGWYSAMNILMIILLMTMMTITIQDHKYLYSRKDTLVNKNWILDERNKCIN